MIAKISIVVIAATASVMAQAPGAPPRAGTPPAGGSPAYQRARMLPARIMEFKAEPESVQPGQAAKLSWSTENPSGVSITPDVGRVTPRGVQQVTPAATTTYTLTVQGPNDQTLTRTVTVNVAGAPASAATAGAGSARKEVPRTADGKPDLSGVYDFSLGAPGARGGRGPAADLPALKPGADKFRVVRGPDDAGQTADCMPLAPPQAFNVPYQFQIVQSAHHVAILHGYPGTFRIIPTDGGPHPADPDPTWMGDSIGHWEQDTLVVDTVGFNDKTEIGGYRHTAALHVIERYHRTDYNSLEYEATVEDPNVFVKPWTVRRRFALRPDLAKVDEFVCEHNEDYSKFFEKK
ncbi:MAG TPA: hypothetical protein VKT49_09455 [Bryobacteraceae bacterium]|nr:hypothetical protein [Bryobacteraceae bacterium]